jgi:chromosome segregation ATPase
MASTDIYELRDQIKRMNSQLQSLNEERISLRKEEQTFEDRLTALRMETSVLSALDEVRFQESKDPIGDGISDSQVLNDRTFLEANLKLELTVFNAEIRQALPRLEKEAIAWEDSFSKYSEALAKQEARQSLLPMRSAEVAEAKAIELQDERRRALGMSLPDTSLISYSALSH